MWHQLLYKWFGLIDPPCETCEVLRQQLAYSEQERRDLLLRLLAKDKPEPPQETTEEHTPITPHFKPWRVRREMYEAEDRKQAQLLRDRTKEIADLEKEVGIK